MEEPIISIIVPIYKAEQYLHKCIKTILNQTFQNFELILVNDGSPDRCGEICDEYASKDHRVKVVHKKNEGVSVARNTGIEVSRGKYIMFADSDDYVENTWCEEMYKVVKNNNESLVVSGYSINTYRGINHKKSTIKINDVKDEIILGKEDFFYVYLRRLLTPVMNKIFVAKVVKDNDIEFNTDICFGEDLLFNLQYLEEANNIIVINKTLYNLISREEESLSKKYIENSFDLFKAHCNEIYKYMLLYNTDLEENRSAFYTIYFDKLERSLTNTFMEQSKLSFLEKIKYNTMIIRSDEYKKCLKEADLSTYSKIYIRLLKSESYFFVLIFKKLSIVKSKFRGS